MKSDNREIATNGEQNHPRAMPAEVLVALQRARHNLGPQKRSRTVADDDDFIGFALARNVDQVLGKTVDPFIPFRPLAVREFPGLDGPGGGLAVGRYLRPADTGVELIQPAKFPQLGSEHAVILRQTARIVALDIDDMAMLNAHLLMIPEPCPGTISGHVTRQELFPRLRVRVASIHCCSRLLPGRAPAQRGDRVVIARRAVRFRSAGHWHRW